MAEGGTGGRLAAGGCAIALIAVSWPTGPVAGALPAGVGERLARSHTAWVLWETGLLAAVVTLVGSWILREPRRIRRTLDCLPTWSPRLPLPFLIAAALALRLAVVSSGFVAMSTDEFTRSLSAYVMAIEADLSYSRAWPPLPFAVQGALFRLGLDLWAAGRVAALLMSLVSLGSVAWLSSQLFGRRAATWSVLFLAVEPWHLWLSTVPLAGIYQCAFLLAAAALVTSAIEQRRPSRFIGSGLALALSCLCRYESWAIAVVFGAVLAWLWWRRRELLGARPGALALASVALPASAALGWMAIHYFQFGDALSFLRRVHDSATDVGRGPGAALRLAFSFGVLGFPFLVLSLRGLAQSRSGASLATRILWIHLAAALALVGAGLVSGLGTAHNIERVLLPATSYLAPFAGLGAIALLRGTPPPHESRPRPLAFAVLLAALLWLGIRQSFHPPRALRSDEAVAIARALRSERAAGRLRATDRVLVEAERQLGEHLATLAISGQPDQIEVYADRRVRLGFFNFQRYLAADEWNEFIEERGFAALVLRADRPAPPGYELALRGEQYHLYRASAELRQALEAAGGPPPPPLPTHLEWSGSHPD